MLPDRVSNRGPLTYESGALPIALRGLAFVKDKRNSGAIISGNLIVLEYIIQHTEFKFISSHS